MKTTIIKKKATALTFVLMSSCLCFATNGDLGGADFYGTSNNPYQISDAADLIAFAKKVNDEGRSDAFAVLTSDICVNACSKNESVLDSKGTINGDSSVFTPWTPIGNEENHYKGTFDGKGHTIRGLFFSDEKINDVGLFGFVGREAIIQNFGVKDSYFRGHSFIGGVIAENDNGSISNVYNAGSVSGTGKNVGGVIGYNNQGFISNVFNTGYVNGIYNDGYDSDDYKGIQQIGGVIGYNYQGFISNVYNTGSVCEGIYLGEYQGYRGNVVGGVVGYNQDGFVINAYNTGSVYGNSDVGGIVGVNEKGSVNNVYNTSTVTGNFTSVGSIVGINKKGSVYNGYFNKMIDLERSLGENEGYVDKIKSMSAEKFTDGTVARLLHNWCEKDGDGCMEDGLNGSIWGQDLSAENSLPDFSGFIYEKNGSINFHGDGAKFDSASIDGASNRPVKILSDMVVSGPISFKRSFSSSGYSTIMLPFRPNISSSEDTIVGVSFYEFSSYTDGVVEVTHIDQKDLRANTPYLIQTSKASEIVFKNGGTFNTKTKSKGTKYENGRYVKALEGGWTIYGTYEYKTWQEGDEGIGKTYAFAGTNGNKASVVGKFGKVAEGAYIYPMRAYLEYEAPAALLRSAANGITRTETAKSVGVASLPNEIEVVVVEKDETIGEQTTKVIGTLDTRTGEIKFANDRWFDLNGRYLGNKKPMQKGSYYNNGKKILVK